MALEVRNKQQETFLSPELLSKLNSLELRARLVVEGFLIGLHKSPFHGFSVEFAEHRPYMAGDPIRHIDWKVYAKTDRYYIKKYEEETNLKTYILLDRSGSMAFGSGAVTKLSYAVNLAGALAYLMLKQRDAVGVTTFHDTISSMFPPRSVMGYLQVLLAELANIQPGGETMISPVLHELANRIKRRGLIIIVSDLLDDPKSIISGLKHFRHRKHEVLIFQILDPKEIDFAFRSDAVFQDMETAEEMNVKSWHVQNAYQRAMNDFLSYYKSQCYEHRIDYTLMNTAQPLDMALLRYLVKRSRLY